MKELTIQVKITLTIDTLATENVAAHKGGHSKFSLRDKSCTLPTSGVVGALERPS